MNWVLDVVLLLVLVANLVRGARHGLAHAVGTLLGALAGGVVAYFAVPLIADFVPDPVWRVVATIGAAIVLLGLGLAVGGSVGGTIGRRMARGPLGDLDRILGAVGALVATALVISLLASSAAALGVPVVSQALGRSLVVGTIERVTPDPVKTFLARVRSVAVRDAIPSIVGAIGGTPPPTDGSDADTETEPLRAAARSVVRVSGNAWSCGQSQSGSGFVIAPDRILTNAHVVAGVVDPVVESPDGAVLEADVVYFDPVDDLAVLAVPGLAAAPLGLGPELVAGNDAIYDGYPFGGPFTTGAAEVLAVGAEQVDDIYGSAASPRDVYTIAAGIQQGDSGGPLLSLDGDVVGIVFAKSATSDEVGFAMTVEELLPVVESAAALTDAVETGSCIRS
jgi:S1-C subfamily serine protease